MAELWLNWRTNRRINRSSRRGLWAAALCVGLFSGGARAQTAPDNTRNNRDDQRQGGVSADKAQNDRADMEIARRIRRALVQDKGLSTYAHNVKIIAMNGHVMLKGPVRSASEKQTVEQRAVQVAGEKNVTSQIEIARP